jgi:hypothetical protein
MLEIKSRIKEEDKFKIVEIIGNVVDVYKDFYITKNNLRLFIKDNLDVFFSCLKQGDKVVFDKNSIVFVTGYSDKSERKYVKILTDNPSEASSLLLYLLNDINIDTYIKIKKNNNCLAKEKEICKTINKII